MIKTLLASAVILSPGAAFAEGSAIVSGRPGKTESAIVAPLGHWQIETEIANSGYSESKGTGGPVKTQTLSLAATSFRYGVAPNTEIEAILAPYSRQRASDASGTSAAEGFGDVTLRLRRNLIGQNGGGEALALIGYVTLPTSTGGIGSNKAGGGLLIPASIALSDRWGLSVTGGLQAIDSEKPGDYAALWSAGAALSFAFTDKWGAFAEAYAERRSGGGADASLDFGVTFLARSNLQLDAGLNIGAAGAAPDLEGFIGIARLF